MSAYETGLSPEAERRVEEIARAQIASLAGLVLRRTSEDAAHFSRSPERNEVDQQIRVRIAEIFGEVLSDFSGHTKGEAPGEPDSEK